MATYKAAVKFKESQWDRNDAVVKSMEERKAMQMLLISIFAGKFEDV